MAARDPEAKARELEGSRRGASTVQAAFREVITRKRFCEQVGIHATTLRRWEREGAVSPRLVPVRNIPTWTFTEADVAVAQRMAAVLREEQGRISLHEAAQLARASPSTDHATDRPGGWASRTK